MDGSNWPIVLIEIVLVFGGVLAFGWWQLRDLDKEKQRRDAAKAANAADTDTRADKPD